MNTYNSSYNSSSPTGMPSAFPTQFRMYQSQTSQIMLATSLGSIVGSLVIIAAYFLDPSLQKKTYIQMVFYGALSDFVGAIGTMFGELEDETPICIAQGWISNVFPLMSIYWTLAITVLLYSIVVKSKPITISKTMHGFILAFSILPTAFAYTTNRVGALEGINWCFITDKTDGSSPSWGLLFWTIFSFYIWIILSIFIMIMLLIIITIHNHRQKQTKASMSSNAKSTSVKKLWLYPAVVIVCWLIPAVYDIHDAVTDGSPYPHKENLQHVALIVPLSQGFVTAVIFVSSSTTLKQLMLTWFCPRQRGKSYSVSVYSSAPKSGLKLSRYLLSSCLSAKKTFPQDPGAQTVVNGPSLLHSVKLKVPVRKVVSKVDDVVAIDTETSTTALPQIEDVLNIEYSK